MISVLKKELLSYFNSAIGYVVLAIFFLYSGFCFRETCLVANSGDLSYTFGNLFTVLVFLVPILTMRLLSEEKKQKTDQLLFTSPVSITSVILGKYFSALLMILLCQAITLVYTLIIAFFTKPNYGLIIGNFIGLFLVGSALSAIGLFLSSITENQIISAISSFGAGIFILFLDSILGFLPIKNISNFAFNISFIQRYNNFTSGEMSLPDVVFFVSVSAAFIFLTVRFFEKRRWS